MVIVVVAVLVSYMIGSIPFGYIIGKSFKKMDIRKYGSGNIGATNVLRAMGKSIGVIVLILDVLKGLVATTLIANYFFSDFLSIDKSVFLYILGLSVVAGHDYTIFLKFKGGKGVSTTLGVLLGLSFSLPEVKLIILILVLIWILIFTFSRRVALASVLTGLSIPITFAIFNRSSSSIIFTLSLALLIVIRHKDNLKRLSKGQEGKLAL